MVHTAISDLFFNYQHANFDALASSLKEDFEFNSADARDAIGKDAQEFLDVLQHVVANCPTVEELVNDFYRRI